MLRGKSEHEFSQALDKPGMSFSYLCIICFIVAGLLNVITRVGF
jgi:hypothetical protein